MTARHRMSTQTTAPVASGESSPDALIVQDLKVRYGRVEVVHGVSFRAAPGQVTCLVGNNGAGKTTTIRGIFGLESATATEISFKGNSLKGIGTHRLARAGVALVPEGRRVYADLTILENLKMGAVSRPGGWRDEETLEEIFELFRELKDRRNAKAGLLSGGQQQMLAIGRAMMARPELLVMDEPSMGLSPVLVDRIFDAMVTLRSQGYTILLSEQNANLALELADHAYILETGHIVEEGAARELSGSARVQAIYLGA